MAAEFAKYLEFVDGDRRYTEVRSLYTSTDAVRLKLEAQAWKREKSDDLQKEAEKEPPEPVIGLLKRLALVEEPEHVLLAGRPGSGKSTALRRLLLELVEAARADESRPLPVLVQLKGDRTIPELIQAEFRRAKQRVALEQIDDWLLDDRLVLLLDGLNEIPSQELRTRVQEFREENSSTPMIFTTRDLSVGGTLGIEHRIEMRPLGESQMREFVTKYLDKRGMPEQVDQLLGQLRNRLREVAETPLLLKMLCDVFDPQTQQIPQNKGELFRLFDSKFDEFKGFASAPVSSDFRRFKSEMLQYLAFRMIQGDPQRPTEAWLTIERDRAEEWLEQLLSVRVDAPGQQAKEWLENLLEYHLLQVAANPRHIEFHHQLFQEYYAAEWLVKQLESIDNHTLKREYLNYIKWTESVTLVLSLADNDSVVSRITKQSLLIDLLLGAKLIRQLNSPCMEYALNLIQSTAICDLLKIFLLGQTHSESAAFTLYEMFNDSDLDNKSEILDALEEIGGIGISLGVLRASDDPNFYWRALIMAEGLDSERIMSLLAISIRDTDPNMQWAAVLALMKNSSDEAVRILLEASESQEFSVRFSASCGLCLLGIESAASKLSECIDNLGESDERTMAIRALIEIYAKKSKEKLREILLNPELQKKATDVISSIEESDLDNYPNEVYSIVKDYNSGLRRAFSTFSFIEFLGQLDVDKKNLSGIEAVAVVMRRTGLIQPKALKYLWEFQKISYQQEVMKTIVAIQSNCMYYNNEILPKTHIHFKSNPQQSLTILNLNIEGNYIAVDKSQGDKVQGNKYSAETVGNLNAGDVTIHGNQNGEQ